MRPKLLRNKKGSIPLLNEFLNFFLTVFPKPLLIGLFLITITAIAGFFMPMILGLFGYECAQNGNQLVLYQIPMNNLLNKFEQDLANDIYNLLGFRSYLLPDNPFPNGEGNKTLLRVPDQCIYTYDFRNGTEIEGYSARCVNCSHVPVGFWEFAGDLPPLNAICISSGYNIYNPVNLFDTISQSTCPQCAPPYKYYFNIDNCHSRSECYFTLINASDATLPLIVDSDEKKYLDNINALNGVPINQDPTQLFSVQCAAYKRPSIYFFSINILDKDLWIFLTIAEFLAIFAMNYYQSTQF